jgi:hypothetical protein
MQRWKHGRAFTLTVNLSLLVALLSLIGGDLGTPREAIADPGLIEVLAEAGELSGDGVDSDAEALDAAAFVRIPATAFQFLAPRCGVTPLARRAWDTPAARAPPTPA